jgi:L-lactate dehydrogenase (cytochrome)
MTPSASFLNVADARLRARRTLPRVVFDYVDGGAEDELTMHANMAAFRDIAFRPRMAVGAGAPSLSIRLFGEMLRLPVILAPCGLTRLLHPDGPIGAAQAAAERGTISVLSTVAGTPLEEVASASSGPMWFQLYSAGGRSESESLIDRAAAAGYRGLVVTVDTPVLGHRERDVRHGVDPPLRITAGGVVHLGPQVLSRPVWAWRMLRDGVQMFNPSTQATLSGPSVLTVSNIASPFRWSDIEWIRGRWNGSLLVKGILGSEDAERAVDCGADGVIVSNHGGRQLEGAPATLRVLPEVVEAVGGDTEVFVDGGIRRGSDVVKAIALGASAVLVGRPYLYGLAAAGRRGVENVLDILRDEMSRTLALLGCSGVDSLDSSWLRPAGSGFGLEDVDLDV